MMNEQLGMLGGESISAENAQPIKASFTGTVIQTIDKTVDFEIHWAACTGLIINAALDWMN